MGVTAGRRCEGQRKERLQRPCCSASHLTLTRPLQPRVRFFKPTWRGKAVTFSLRFRSSRRVREVSRVKLAGASTPLRSTVRLRRGKV